MHNVYDLFNYDIGKSLLKQVFLGVGFLFMLPAAKANHFSDQIKTDATYVYTSLPLAKILFGDEEQKPGTAFTNIPCDKIPRCSLKGTEAGTGSAADISAVLNADGRYKSRYPGKF